MIDEDHIRQLVRRVVDRTVGRDDSSARPSRGLVSSDEVRSVPIGGELVVGDPRMVTPLARQVAMERRVRIVDGGEPGPREIGPRPSAVGSVRVVAIGADHGGVELKRMLVESLTAGGFEVVDCGTHGTESVDYPDIAFAVARMVADKRAWRGIIVDGAGIGSCMVANKVPGILAALCYDEATAQNSREHNHANVLTLGAGMIGPGLARRIVSTWLETPAGGGRHKRRADKILEIERSMCRGVGGAGR
jgi:ribose 5-phosphate isomerase B